MSKLPCSEFRCEWRKVVKHHWHHLELFTPLWPSVVGAQADEAHRLADLLGDDHDVTVLTELVDELPAELKEQADTLREDALALGARLYADSPNAFEARFRAWWAAPKGSGS